MEGDNRMQNAHWRITVTDSDQTSSIDDASNTNSLA
jgi:hypothetical protein